MQINHFPQKFSKSVALTLQFGKSVALTLKFCKSVALAMRQLKANQSFSSKVK